MENSLELVEKKFPGSIIGKAVIDEKADCVGIAKSLRLKIPKFELSLLIQGVDSQGKIVEWEVPISDIKAIGTMIRILSSVKSLKRLDEREVLKLRNDLGKTIKSELQQIFTTV